MICTSRDNKEAVVLIHGLSRTSRSMGPMKKMLESNGYSTFNLNYPSRKKPIEELSKFVIHKIKQHFYDKPVQKFHFVTHSMGGIILREIMKSSPIANIGRVVMLGPPNQGSEIVDKLAPFKLISLVNGPACVQLGTSPTSYIHTLGPVQFELGVIAGNRSINPFLSYLITGLDDGKVSVERTKVDGMKDFREVPCSHSFLMGNRTIQKETIHFLEKGYFSKNNK